MLFSFAAVALSSAVAVLAADINVSVGNGALAFDPTSVTAQAGDIVHFEFRAKNHSVTQSTFANPCTQAPNGVDSGFFMVQAGATEVPSWSITIDDPSTPLWFFCAQTTPVNHCNGGMVFAINPTPERTFDAFQAAARIAVAGTPATGGTTNTTNSATTGGTTTGATGAGNTNSSPTGGSGTTASTSSPGFGNANPQSTANPPTSTDTNTTGNAQQNNNGGTVALGISGSSSGVVVVTLVAAVMGLLL